MQLSNAFSTSATTQRFRRRHLHCTAGDAALLAAAERLFDDFFELEWIFEHRFGAAAHALAGAACALLSAQGWPCRLQSCRAELRRGRQVFHLGAKAWAKPGDIEGHAVCLVGEHHLLDFALGSVRRSFDRGFPWAIVCPAVAQGGEATAVDLGGHGRLRWLPTAQPDAVPQQRIAGTVQRMLREYEALFGASLLAA